MIIFKVPFFPAFDGIVMAISKGIVPTNSKGSTIKKIDGTHIKCDANITEKRNHPKDLHEQGRSLTAQVTENGRYTLNSVCLTP